MIKRIFAARGKDASEYILGVWTKGVCDFCLEKNITEEKIISGCKDYFRSTDDFPVLGKLLDKIKPSAKSTADADMRMVDEYAQGKRTRSSLPEAILRAIDASGGIHDYQHSTQYSKDAWVKKFKASRANRER